MNSDSAFLEHLEANPDDYTTRLVYADWLDERDDPRGRYLRLELALAGLGPEDPRSAPLEEELQALCGALDLAWRRQAGKRHDALLCAYEPVRKINVIKVIRELTGVGLKEAKDLSEAPPPVPILGGLSWAEARQACAHLAEAGGALGRAGTRLSAPGTPRSFVPQLRPVLPWLRPTRGATHQLLLLGYPPLNKIPVIRVIRELTGLGLKAAKDLSELPPPVALARFTDADAAWEAGARFQGIAEVEVRAVKA
jgi:uncharacterized protein (TIGR02996 family)